MKRWLKQPKTCRKRSPGRTWCSSAADAHRQSPVPLTAVGQRTLWFPQQLGHFSRMHASRPRQGTGILSWYDHHQNGCACCHVIFVIWYTSSMIIMHLIPFCLISWPLSHGLGERVRAKTNNQMYQNLAITSHWIVIPHLFHQGN